MNEQEGYTVLAMSATFAFCFLVGCFIFIAFDKAKQAHIHDIKYSCIDRDLFNAFMETIEGG